MNSVLHALTYISKNNVLRMEIIHKFTDVELILHDKNFTQYLEKLKLNNVPNMKDNKSMLNPLKCAYQKLLLNILMTYQCHCQNLQISYAFLP